MRFEVNISGNEYTISIIFKVVAKKKKKQILLWAWKGKVVKTNDPVL